MPSKHRADPLLPIGTVTFLFTDIEGSTKLWETQRAAMQSRWLATMRCCAKSSNATRCRRYHELDEDFFRAEDFFFEDVLFLVNAFLPEAAFFLGTFAPARRASESPIAIACFRLVTFFPDFPLFKVPLFCSCITFLTFACAFFPYLAIVFS
jgi:hypothetical protein